MNLSIRARDFAEERHAGQLYGTAPYSVHLSAVVCVLHDCGYREESLLAAGWLHDVVEDGRATREEVQEHFGPEVAALVEAVTGVGQNRRERNASVYLKLFELPAAVPIKLADRIANVENCWRTQNPLLFMYWREYPEFRKALRLVGAEGGIERMWARLDALMGK